MPFQKGNPGNPGGFSRAQIKTRKMIEGLSMKAVRRIDQLIDSTDEQVALAASKLIVDRVAPVPKAQPTNVNIAIGGGHAAAVRAIAERRQLVALPVPEDEVTATPLDRVSDSE
jgi:hypothetical protein